ncbi:Methyltransferase-like protein 6 [Strongyloides ratti]|uniref:tRNA N(3)-methylcytidine methyltransferase n=1 Tax=Strongyloides ratti TaxID=34506 RepID=A0A090LL64_STRRB|nr:Methyltransferase-like protein 6 [Strongyloides ratti]CEF68265.1 Methyltransferase-like protein 6 [Strongyloides ratti]
MSDSEKFKISNLTGRELTECDIELLSKQSTCPPTVLKSATMLSRKNWDIFYKRNKDNFFKDRHWSKRDLEEACPDLDFLLPLTYLEVGCGVGNMLFPIKEYFPHWDVYGFDFSDNAINIVKEKGISTNVNVNVCVLDLTDSEKVEEVSNKFPLVDISTLIFVLSAIEPSKHKLAIENMLKFIKKGGIIFFRDYGLNDNAMIRFGWGTKIDERFYVRSDNTTSYFFTLDEIKSLFTSFNCEVICCEYLLRKTTNHKKNLSVDRVFVQGVFKKL